MSEITVIKCNPAGEEVWRYSGEIIEREEGRLVLEARFNGPETDLYGIRLVKDDRFVETYYTDRWYNIFEVHDRQDDLLKGWYCNIARPAEIRGDVLYYVDLALDLLVFPNGCQMTLDEDEFINLHLDVETTQKARLALEELRACFTGKLGREGAY